MSFLNTMNKNTNQLGDESDSDYSLDYEYIGPRNPNYRNEEDADSDASELSCDSSNDGVDMCDEDHYSNNDFIWESNDMKLTSFIKKRQRELKKVNPNSCSFWRKEKGWPRQLPYSNSTTNHDQSANALSLVVSDFGSFEELRCVYKDRILNCGEYPTLPKDQLPEPIQNSTTWIEHTKPTFTPSSTPLPPKKLIETHASISLSHQSTVPNPHPSTVNNTSDAPLISKFIPYTKYIKRSQFPITLPHGAHLELAFEPMCLTEKYGFMAIGGIEGEFELYCCMGPRPTKIWGTKFKGKNNVLLMTNSIQLVRFPKGEGYQHYLIACMNDAGIVVYDLPSHGSCQRQQPQLQCHLRHFDRMPINDARISPDGQHLVCVGDGPNVFYLAVSSDPTLTFGPPLKLEIPSGLLEVSPLVFSSQYVCWSANSRYVAHTSDSHPSVFVWRTQPRLELVQCIPACGYTYAIQFHPVLEGLLVFSNRYGYFHTVDLEEANRHEITMVSFRGERDRRLRILAKINGLQWSNDGSYLYVATKKRVLAYAFMKARRVQSLARIATKTALSILDQDEVGRKRKAVDQVQSKKKTFFKKWDDMPLLIKEKIVDQHVYLASHD